MEVITKYPIVVTNSTAQSDSEYRSTYSGVDGGDVLPTGTMDVITDYPIVYTDSNAQSKSEYRATYSGASGNFLSTQAGRERRAKRRKERQSSGNTFGDKVKKFGQTAVGQALLGKLTGKIGEQGGTIDTSYVPTPEPEGMSKGMKIGLVVGGVAILGLGAWLLLRKKK
jgi:hypothetical protein